MRAKPPVPTIDEIRVELEAHGITHVGVAPATPMLRARTALAERKASGFADNMSFTWRNPERSTTPTASVAEAQSIIVAALPYLVDDVTPPTGRRAHIARYARTDHYSILRTALRSAARNLKMAGERAVAFADDNALVDREAAYRAGIGWFGKCQPARPRSRQLLRARQHYHDRNVRAFATGRRRLRLVHTMP